jgi:hypothetical protein
MSIRISSTTPAHPLARHYLDAPDHCMAAMIRYRIKSMPQRYCHFFFVLLRSRLQRRDFGKDK